MRPPLPSARRPATGLALAGLAAPTALAFAKGGYFEGARDVALIGVGILLALTALVVPRRAVRPGRHAVLALAGLAGLTLWTALSASWAPLDDPAWATFERDALYLGALVAATALLRGTGGARLAEPVLALGALVTVGYGLLGRLIPDVVHAVSSASAGGRLDQPLTYWNAMGALGAAGLVLCARLAGDATRTPALRAAAAAGAVPLAVGIYLTFSRGALAATAAGLVVLLALAPSYTQLRAVAITVEAGIVGCAVAAASPAVRTLHGSHPVLQGAAVLVALVAVMALAAGVQRWACAVEAEQRTRMGALALPRRHGWIAAALVAAMLVVPVAVAAGQDAPSSTDPRFGASTSRLASADSPRYHYWKVALNAFAGEPVKGIGAGGFAVRWLRERPVLQPARDAHSLEIETLAELGVVGAALLALLGAGVLLATRDVIRRGDVATIAGSAAALAAYAFHASIDWDWEMPALTLVGVALAGALLAASADED
ncbi:MAG TPA: O-antigen ligase family protein [Baekduia sp.]|nr:O-antigen ligase family protein [Baekduia sp.]